MKNLKHKPGKQHHYEPKPLSFRTPLNGISDRTLKSHHDKLYIGYVDKKNEIENQLEELGREIVKNGKTGNATYSELRAAARSSPGTRRKRGCGSTTAMRTIKAAFGALFRSSFLTCTNTRTSWTTAPIGRRI